MKRMKKTYLAGLLPEEISEIFPAAKSFRSTQIFEWIHKPVFELEAMSNLPGDLRACLSERAVTLSSRIIQTVRAADKSLKYRIRLEDQAQIEAVLLMDRAGRITACLSTQAGCGMGCAFCGTARMGFIRNLGVHEIIEQYLLLKSQEKGISHIVFMGMGEPLANLVEVRKAICILHHPSGAGLSYRKMTVSTCGLTAGIEDLAGQGPYVRLALSLVTADPDLRKKLLPAAKANPLPQLKQALLAWQKATGKRITLEIVILPGVNDRKEDFEALKDFALPLEAVINVIPWNKVQGLPFTEPGPRQVADFINQVRQRGLKVSERFRRGRSINAACGQLCIANK
jgi:23S rRNA (adenine2503-C2)-methyltransferase